MRELLTIGKVWELAQHRAAHPRRGALRSGGARRAGDRARPGDAAGAAHVRVGRARGPGRASRAALIASFLGDPRRTAVVGGVDRRGDAGHRDARAALAAARAAGPRPRAGRRRTPSSAHRFTGADERTLRGGAALAAAARRAVRGHVGAPPACADHEAATRSSRTWRSSRFRSCSDSALDRSGARAALAGARP